MTAAATVSLVLALATASPAAGMPDRLDAPGVRAVRPQQLAGGLERDRRRFSIDHSLGEPSRKRRDDARDGRDDRRNDGLDGMPGHGVGVYTGQGVGSYSGGGIGSYTGGGLGSLGGAATREGRGLRPHGR